MIIRKDDTVMVMKGDDKGSTGRVLRILNEANKVVVEGVNRVYRHMKPSRRNQQGGRLSKEMPVAVANVQIFCPSCRTGVRVGKRIEGGKKERVCKKCGGGLGLIADSNKTKKK